MKRNAIPKQKGVFKRVMKALFRYYPVMTTVTIFCLIVNAVISSIPAIFMQNIFSVLEEALNPHCTGARRSAGRKSAALLQSICLC